jgi:hypothetical protein
MGALGTAGAGAGAVLGAAGTGAAAMTTDAFQFKTRKRLKTKRAKKAAKKAAKHAAKQGTDLREPLLPDQ